jgi:SpoVK/Ycf46/Vps4 family AAA+-type ATPase
LEHREWYDKKGIPYTLGFLFHGPPGCGKTSSVKAIANEGRRHIINIQLSEIKTKTQLQHLFFNDDIHVYNGTNTEKYTIPVSERLYVIEDIDAMGDTVLRREWKKPEPVKAKSEEDAWLDRQKESEKETIDLSFLLNLLDGTLEANGRILVITTNFPERIDRALIRPGRVDMIVNFKRCNRAVMQEMLDAFYDQHVEMPDDETLDGKWSRAEVNQILFRNFAAPEAAVDELVNQTRASLYGFDEQNGSTAIDE